MATKRRDPILIIVTVVAISVASVLTFIRVTEPDDIDNECLAALLLVEPDARDAIPDEELEDKCPGAERFDLNDR